MWPIKISGGSSHITKTAEPKVIKFCILVGYINSSNRMTYHTQKGCGYGHVTVLKFCRSSWCSASRGFVSDSWATCYFCEFFLRLCEFWWKSVKKFKRESVRRRTHGQRQTVFIICPMLYAIIKKIKIECIVSLRHSWINCQVMREVRRMSHTIGVH